MDIPLISGWPKAPDRPWLLLMNMGMSRASLATVFGVKPGLSIPTIPFRYGCNGSAGESSYWDTTAETWQWRDYLRMHRICAGEALHLNCFRTGLPQSCSFMCMCSIRNGAQEVFMETKPRSENWGAQFLQSKITERTWKPFYGAGFRVCWPTLATLVCGAEHCTISSWNSHHSTEQ